MAEPTSSDKRPTPSDKQPTSGTTWKNPIVWIAFLIIGGVFTLILFAMIGWDGGLLERLGTPQFARGLITYLFAITTICAAVVLLVASLTTLVGLPEAEANEKYQRGKDVLGLLLGVFGTIVGFYFGTSTEGGPGTQLTVTAPALSPDEVLPGQPTTLTSAVSGGSPPYRFAIGTSGDAFGDFESVQTNGVIVVQISGDAFPADGDYEVRLRVVDSIGTVKDADAELQRVPPPTAQ
jgi:hypothetical protein